MPVALQNKRPRFDSPQQEAWLNLWRTYDKLRELEDRLFGHYGLSAQQYNTLRLLRAAHPDSIPTLTLGQRLISRAPDMTRLLDKLEARRLILRERRAENRRVVNVAITQAGMDLLEEIADAVTECHRRQLGHLTRRELQQLSQLLKRARQPHEDQDHLSLADQ